MCILLERVKRRLDVDGVEKAVAAVEVLVRDWKVDPNMVFIAHERRRVSGAADQPEVFNYRIRSTPLSWLVYQRFGDRRDDAKVLACMAHLLRRRANPNVPFHFVIEGADDAVRPSARYNFWMQSRKHDAKTNALNGRSLLSAAMASKLELACIDMLLEYGARFVQGDPHPFRAAVKEYGAKVAVPLFHKHWLLGNVTPHDVLSADTGEDCEGLTAMHDIAKFPPGEGTVRKECFEMMLEMGFTPPTGGWDALQQAEEANLRFETLARKDMVEMMHGVQKQHRRAMEMATFKAMRDVRGGMLSSDTVRHVFEYLPVSHTVAQIAMAEARVQSLSAAR
jgi:hypothetical protein